jgi:hypothetical protein
MPQDEDLAIERVHAVERLLKPGVQAHRHHPPQPAAVPLEPLDEGRPIQAG